MYLIKVEDIYDLIVIVNLVACVKSCTILPLTRSISPPIPSLISSLTWKMKPSLIKLRNSLPFDFTGSSQTKIDLCHHYHLIG